MNLANNITLTRIILIPVFIITLVQGHHPWPLVIFSFTMITDALDGFIARRRKQKTVLGSILDPLGDKLLILSSFLVFVFLKRIDLWVFIVLLSRDLLIVIGWIVTYIITGSIKAKPRLLGKITTIIQMVSVGLILIGIPSDLTQKVLIVMVIITAVSGFDYLIKGSMKINSNV